MRKGISMIALAITLAVLAIIAGAIIITNDKMSDESQAMLLLNEMKILQSKVYEYQLNHEDNETDYPYIGTIVTSGDYIDYYEVNKEDLEKMNINNIDNTYLINYLTQDIIFKEGISINGTKYFTIDEINEKVNVLQN